MGSKNSHTARKVQLAKEYLLAHPNATDAEIVGRLEISSRTVTYARQQLRLQGELPRSFYDRKSARVGEGSAEPDTASDPSSGPVVALSIEDSKALESYLKGANVSTDPLTVDQMRARYSAIARHAAANKEFTLEIAALQALARLDQQVGARDALGPGVPHTREQRTTRVTMIVDAAGPSITADAVVRAYERPELDRFIDEVARYMVKKAEKEGLNVISTQNPPAQSSDGDVENQISGQIDARAEVGGGSGPDSGQVGEDGGSEGRVRAGETDLGSDRGPKGS